jgi:hypothetical protein
VPNSRTLCVELLNTGITLLESMLLTDHRQIERVTRGLIPLAKMIPHLRSSRKSHELRGKLWQNTSSKNSRSMSILITPLSISSLSITISGESLREICYLLIISINRSIIGGLGSSPVSLRSINSNNGGIGGTGATVARGCGGQGTSPQRTPQSQSPRI